MICSMTGYAVKTRDLEHGTLQLELKSVNSRYLDFHFRVAEDLRALEIPLRELLAGGAIVRVCGSRAMARGVAEALDAVLAPLRLSVQQLKAQERYAEDLF